MKTSYCSGKNTNKFVDFCFLAPSNRNFSPAWQKNKELLCQEFELEQASSGRKWEALPLRAVSVLNKYHSQGREIQVARLVIFQSIGCCCLEAQSSASRCCQGHDSMKLRHTYQHSISFTPSQFSPSLEQKNLFMHRQRSACGQQRRVQSHFSLDSTGQSSLSNLFVELFHVWGDQLPDRSNSYDLLGIQEAIRPSWDEGSINMIYSWILMQEDKKNNSLDTTKVFYGDQPWPRSLFPRRDIPVRKFLQIRKWSGGTIRWKNRSYGVMML